MVREIAITFIETSGEIYFPDPLTDSDAGTYTDFEARAVAVGSENKFKTKSNFTMIINRLPVPSVSIPGTTITAYDSVTQVGPVCPWFTDPDGDSFTISVTVTPTPPDTLTVFDQASCKVNISASTNSDVGTYTVTVGAYDAGNRLYLLGVSYLQDH